MAPDDGSGWAGRAEQRSGPLIERYRGVKPNELRATQRVELGLAPVPPIAVVTRACTVLPDSPLVTDAIAPTIVFTTAAAPAERACTWCDFRPVCGPREEERVKNKAADKIADLEALRSMR